MKKKLKGLVALIMAMAMVVPMTSYAFGAISEEKYEEKKDYYNYVEVYELLNKELDEVYEIEDLYIQDTVAVGGELSDLAGTEVWSGFSGLYTLTKWKIWGRTEDGGIDSDNTKTVGFDYVITAEDIKQFGCVGKDEEDKDVYYAPLVQTIYTSETYSIDVYDENGNKVDTITVNSDTEDVNLDIPEGYIGYMMTTEYYDEYNSMDNDNIEKVFVADYEDIWTEIEILTYWGYNPVKLEPTKSMPYYVGYLGDIWTPGAVEEQVVYLEPGEVIIENKEIKEKYKYYDYVADEVEWDVWRINYCGGCSDIPSIADEPNSYEIKITRALTVEDYTDARKCVYSYGYSDTFNGITNYPDIVSNDIVETEYLVPYYDVNGNHVDDYSLCINDLEYEFANAYEPVSFWISPLSDEYDFEFIYNGKNYGVVEYNKDIWDVAIAGGNYDSTKAKLIPVCAGEHDFDYENGKVISQPTLDKKGSTEYKCEICGAVDVLEDIDKLSAIESVILGQTTYTYTGSNIVPTITVKAYVDTELVTLTKDVDYTVLYSNNKMPGFGNVTVTGKGKFAGTKTAQFTIKPSKVNNLKATAGVNEITLTWDAVTGATGYFVYASAESGEFEYIGETKKTSFTTSNLPDGVEYEYKVAAYVKTTAGNVKGAYSDAVTEGAKIALDSLTLSRNTFTYTGDYIKPITTVKAYVNGKETILTNWKDYKVEYKNFKNPGVATLTVTGRGNYYGTLTTTFTIKPNWVKNVSQVAESTYTKNLRITWDKVVGVTGYEIYMSTEKLGTYTKVGTITSNEFISTNLEAGTSYYYKVRAYKTVNRNKIYGSYSNILKATTRTVPPSKVMTGVTLNTNTITWWYSKGAVGYEVYMSTVSKFIGNKVASTTSAVRNVTIPGLETGKTYYVRVRAYTTTATGTKMYTGFTNYVSFRAK